MERSVELKLKATMDTKAAERNIDSLAAHVEAKARQIQALPKHQQRAAIERAAYDTLVRTRAATGVNAPADAQNMAMMRRAMQGAVQVIQVEQDALAQQQMDAHQQVAASAEKSNARLQRFAYVATYSVVPAIAALSSSSGQLSKETRQALTNVNKFAAAMGAMSATGTAIGGKAGDTMLGLGAYGMVASAIATSVVGAVDAYIHWLETDRDIKNSSDLMIKQRRAEQVDAYIKRGGSTLNPASQSEMAAARAELKKLRAEIAQMQAEEQALRVSGDARRDAIDLSKQMMTPDELKRQMHSDAMAKVNEINEAIALRDAAFGNTRLEGRNSLLKARDDLQKRANDLLEEIRDDGRTWRDYAMESLIKSERTSRPFSLRELQSAGPRQVRLDINGMGDDLAAALWRRMEPSVFELANALAGNN